MTREEQIIHKAGSIVDGMISNYVPQDLCDNYYQGFIDSAKWADENPKEGLVSIDKVCELLSQYISPEDIYDGETNEVPNTYLTVNIYDNMVDFINAFRKAMEE